jgi:signal transduction histidine kinase
LGFSLGEVMVGAAAAALGAFLQMATLREENTILGAMLGSRVREPSRGVRHSPGDNDAPVSRQPMELGRIIDAALVIARAAFGAYGQRFTATVPDVGVSIEVDGGRITHVVTSLLAAAALCGPRGGGVHVDAAQEGDWAVLSVQHGLESHRELLPHAFDGLGSVFDDEDAIGSGARRPSVRSIVEQHGGSISVETHPGTSSRYMLRLPLARTLDRGRRRGPLMQGDAKVIRLDTVRDEGGVEGRRRLVVRSKFRSSRG